jgi:predicted amidohydrolase YtcJ
VERALAGYLTSPENPGGQVRKIAPGEAADLVVLDRQWRQMIDDPAAVRVRATLIGGRPASDDGI